MPWAQKHVQSDTGMTARQLRTGMGWMCANVHIDKTENGIKRRQSPFQLGFGGLTTDEVGHCDYKKVGETVHLDVSAFTSLEHKGISSLKYVKS